MIIIFIILILIIIIFLSAYISTLNKKKNIEGYADLSSPGGTGMEITDKPSESDKLIVLNELFNNVIKHETALNVYDPTYIADKTIHIENIDPMSAESYVSAVFKNCMNIIPILQRQDIEILQLSSNGYIQSKILKDLLNISGCLVPTDISGGLVITDPSGVTLDKIRNCGSPEIIVNPEVLVIFNRYRGMLLELQIYQNERNGRAKYHVDNIGVWNAWKTAPTNNNNLGLKTPPSKEYLEYFEEIFKKNNRIDFYDIRDMMFKKLNLLPDNSANLSKEQVRQKFYKLQAQYESYYRERDENRNVDNIGDFTIWIMSPWGNLKTPFPGEYIRDFIEMWNTYKGISRNVIDDQKKNKLKVANKINPINNAITLLANDLYRLVNNTSYVNKNQLAEITDINNTGGQLQDGTFIPGYENGDVKDTLKDLRQQSAVKFSEHNPPMSETQALAKIESVVLFYIVEVVKYQDLEIQNISKNALAQFKKVYSIYT